MSDDRTDDERRRAMVLPHVYGRKAYTADGRLRAGAAGWRRVIERRYAQLERRARP